MLKNKIISDMLSCCLILFMLKKNRKHFQKRFIASQYGALNVVTQNKRGQKNRVNGSEVCTD